MSDRRLPRLSRPLSDEQAAALLADSAEHITNNVSVAAAMMRLQIHPLDWSRNSERVGRLALQLRRIASLNAARCRAGLPLHDPDAVVARMIDEESWPLSATSPVRFPEV